MKELSHNEAPTTPPIATFLGPILSLRNPLESLQYSLKILLSSPPNLHSFSSQFVHHFAELRLWAKEYKGI